MQHNCGSAGGAIPQLQAEMDTEDDCKEISLITKLCRFDKRRNFSIDHFQIQMIYTSMLACSNKVMHDNRHKHQIISSQPPHQLSLDSLVTAVPLPGVAWPVR